MRKKLPGNHMEKVFTKIGLIIMTPISIAEVLSKIVDTFKRDDSSTICLLAHSLN